MATIQESIVVDRPIEEAFAYTADFSNVADWDPGVVSVEALDGGPPAVGARYDLVVAFGRSEVPMRYEITELDAPGRVVLVGEGKGLTAIDTIEFTAADGGTRIDYTAELEFRNFIRFIERFMGRVFDGVGKKAMAGLSAALGGPVAS